MGGGEEGAEKGFVNNELEIENGSFLVLLSQRDSGPRLSQRKLTGKMSYQSALPASDSNGGEGTDR